jgi:CID domain
MSDSLRSLLKDTDLSAPSIQGAAKAMLRQYDKSALTAVTEWRNALHQARPDQILPLLYVANEVLQQSKRNRGNKFLEAFTPTLGQSLSFMCEKSPPETVEKIRRTVKIWGERHVFSVRYVNELVKGLEMYRNGGRNNSKSSASSSRGAAAKSSPSMSPADASNSTVPAGHGTGKNVGGGNSSSDSSDNDVEMSPTGSDNMFGDDDGDDDDGDDLFGNATSKLLKIDVDLDQAASAAKNDSGAGDKKRRRSSFGSTGSGGGKSPGQPTKRKSVLSTNSLMELWSSVSALQNTYDIIESSTKEIEGLDDTAPTSDGTPVDELVGDELLMEYKKVLKFEQRLTSNQREMHQIANARHVLEKEAVRYLPWLERALKQDKEDAAFCETYRRQLLTFKQIQAQARAARDRRLAEEADRKRQEEEERKKKQDEEDRRKFMEAAMAKQTVAEDGMVWNRATGEYQYLNQDESWRD